MTVMTPPSPPVLVSGGAEKTVQRTRQLYGRSLHYSFLFRTSTRLGVARFAYIHPFFPWFLVLEGWGFEFLWTERCPGVPLKLSIVASMLPAIEEGYALFRVFFSVPSLLRYHDTRIASDLEIYLVLSLL